MVANKENHNIHNLQFTRNWQYKNNCYYDHAYVTLPRLLSSVCYISNNNNNTNVLF